MKSKKIITIEIVKQYSENYCIITTTKHFMFLGFCFFTYKIIEYNQYE